MTYDTLPDDARVQAASAALIEHGFSTHTVADGAAALELIKTMIPAGASVTNGTSKTLEAIGLVEYLKGDTHGWRNLHAEVLAESDPVKQARLRKESVLADYYLGSVHAVSETGELVIASASGSQLPSIVFTSDHVIFVVSTKKITPTLTDALDRLKTYVFPLEDARMKATGAPGSVLSKTLIYERHPGWGRTMDIIFVNEVLGF
jgi:hypothetical protein